MKHKPCVTVSGLCVDILRMDTTYALWIPGQKHNKYTGAQVAVSELPKYHLLSCEIV